MTNDQTATRRADSRSFDGLLQALAEAATVELECYDQTALERRAQYFRGFLKALADLGPLPESIRDIEVGYLFADDPIGTSDEIAEMLDAGIEALEAAKWLNTMEPKGQEFVEPVNRIKAILQALRQDLPPND